MIKMQDKAQILREAVSNIVKKQREAQDKEYLVFCDENSLSTSTYDNIINGATNTTFFNLSKIVKGLNLNFEQFGKLLDAELPPEFWDEE